MRSQEIRQTFLDFFKEKGHEIVPSSSLVPANDKTLLFTNAGMVQFKDVFLGVDKRNYSRATTSQKCVRAGGKHNDLENVGYTARHHTFFEMLGNFSFGDYFKEEAICYAWELVTERFGLPAEKLWVSVYADDQEAFDIWTKKVGVPAERISRIATSDNFWQMGDTGPCGPCTEIFYDHGEHIWGGPPGSPEEDGDRFIEIWNLVFMEYDRQADGELVPLPKPSVDTGMGLERIAAILQGVHSNYEIDLFVALIAAAQKATGAKDLSDNSLKVIADHIRSVVFLLVDGIVPSNEGRGYVLRRIIRRAVRHGYKLGQKQAFFYQLVGALVEQMGDAYPEIRENQARIEAQIQREELRFHRTIEDGMAVLEADLETLTGDTISGDTLFKLYDTYGFPVDLTADIARERGLKVDLAGYDEAMARQVKRSQASGSFKANHTLKTDSCSEFLGYDSDTTQATITEIFINEQGVDSVNEGEDTITIILDKTPFYAESGGQVGDIGAFYSDTVDFTVIDTQKQGEAIMHIGYLGRGSLAVGDSVSVEVDAERREDIKRNHSATHLLHAALHNVLGAQAVQKGSLVNDERLRFDFSHDSPLTAEQLASIEEIANQQVFANHEVKTQLMSQKEAKAMGAMALFGEKYGDVVRVVTIGADSIELCGGTHVKRSGDIGQIIITSESGVAAGIRRIEAVTGWGAMQYMRENREMLRQLIGELKTTPENALHKVSQLFETQKDLQKQIKALKQRALSNSAESDVVSAVKTVGNFRVLTAALTDYSASELRDFADQQRDKNQVDLVVMASAEEGKVRLVASVAKSASGKLHAGEIISQVAAVVGGKGGGRPDFAQAGGSDVSQIPAALACVEKLVSQYN